MNVFIYLRVSGKGQIDKDGFPRQREAVAKFCERHNLAIFGEFQERGVSGTDEGMDRPDFADMVRKAEAMTDFKVEAIVVESMDRLARDLMVSELLLRECRDRGLKVFCTDQVELTDMSSAELEPTRILMRQILGAIAQWEKTRLVQKLRAARGRNRLKKGWSEGKKPYGHTQREGDILKEMRDMLKAEASYQEIADAMNKKGYRTRFHREWNKTNVHTVLSGRRRKVLSVSAEQATLTQ